MSKRIEILVNAQCENGVTLARIRNVANAKTIKLTNCKPMLSLGKNDGAVITADSFVEKGNYLIPVNCKVLDTHISGKSVDMDEYLEALAKSELAF